MAKKKHFYSLQWQALTSTISTTFVLILLGLTLLCMLFAHRVSENVRQSFTVTTILSDEATDSTAQALQKELKCNAWVKDITFVSAEDVLKEQTEAMGADPTEFLDGKNPYLPMLELHLRADCACSDSLLWISKALKAHPEIVDVVYQKDIVEQLNAKLHKFSYIFLAISLALALITIVLINNTVRLSVYSRRFLIHTMRLVGAGWGFIRRPFMRRSLCIGLVAGLLADGVLGGIMAYFYRFDAETAALLTEQDLLLTGVSVLGCGLLLTLVCTYFSVSHFLSMRESELYG